MKKFLIILFLSVSIFISGFLFLNTAYVNAEVQEDVMNQFNAAVGEEGAGLGEYRSPFAVIGDIVQALLGFLGVIFLLLLIYGGFLWMTASGNEEQVKKAKGLIRSAIIGLTIVLAAEIVSYFVIDAILGAVEG